MFAEFVLIEHRINKGLESNRFGDIFSVNGFNINWSVKFDQGNIMFSGKRDVQEICGGTGADESGYLVCDSLYASIEKW